MPKNVNLNHFSMWRSGKKIVGLSPNSNAEVVPEKSRKNNGLSYWFVFSSEIVTSVKYPL